MICSLLPTIAIAAGESLNVQESNEGGEKLVVVTYVVPNAVNVTSIQLNVKFDTSKLEARDINWPSIPGFGAPVGSNATETNTNGFFGCSWSVADNTMTPANLNLVTAKFAIKSGASGPADFTITDLVIADENTDDRIAESGATQTGATYTIPKAPITTVTASVTAPAAGAALATTGTVASSAPYSITTVEWFEGTDASGTPVTAPATAKANTEYTAKITLTAKTGESFADSATIPTGYTKDSSSTSSKLVLTKTFPATGDLPASVADAPTAKSGLKYTGSEQDLLGFMGNATNGTMQYSLDNSHWSAALPKGKNAGDYTVYYKAKGNSGYSDSAVGSVIVTIARKDISTAPSVTIGTIADQPYTDGAIEPNPEVKDGTTTLVKDTDYTVSCTHTYVGTDTATFTITGKGNYTGTKSVNFDIVAADQNPTFTTPVDLAKGGHRLDLRTLVQNAKGDMIFTIASGTAANLSGHELASTGTTGAVTIKVSIGAKDMNGDGKNEYNAYS